MSYSHHRWLGRHATFLATDLRSRHCVSLDPWGGSASRSASTALARTASALSRVTGVVHYLGSPAFTCPHYGPQMSLQMSEPVYGSGLCFVLAVLVFKAFLRRLLGVYGSDATTPAQFLDAFRLAQLDVGASDSPWDARAAGRVQGAVDRLVRRYV